MAGLAVLGFMKLVEPSLKQQFTEQKWVGQKQLFYPILPCFKGHLTRNLIETGKRAMSQFVDDGRLPSAWTSSDDNFFRVQIGKILDVKFGIKFFNKKCKVKCIFAPEKMLMSSYQNPEEFYKKLKGQLYETSSWPSEYLYKFIIPTAADKIKQIEDLFDNLGAVINTIESKNGKYTSVSINVQMEDPDAVILKYKEVALHVEGVISL